MPANPNSPSETVNPRDSSHDLPLSPLPGVNGDQAENELNALLNEAREFATRWIDTQRRSAADFVQAMGQRFGSMIRMYLLDLVRDLRMNWDPGPALGDYFTSTLSDSQLAQALGEGPARKAEIASLDELFRRSTRLRSSKMFAEAITFAAKFRHYSPFNNFLVYLQNPSATYWATAAHWRRIFRREVKDDARSMIILAPMTPVLLVYDLEDTVGGPLPKLFEDPFAAEGQFQDGVLAQTIENCSRDGVQIVMRKLGMLHAGSAILSNRPERVKLTVELNQELDSKARYGTLCHELAHIHLGHLGSDRDDWWPSRLELTRNQKELEAQAVSYVVCRRASLTTKSAEYLAGYLKNPEELSGISIDLILRVAGRLERMGKEELPPRKPKG